MAINYYPPCPAPELTYGLPGHVDPSIITILLQDDVPALQVLKDGKWIAVNPIPYPLLSILVTRYRDLNYDSDHVFSRIAFVTIEDIMETFAVIAAIACVLSACFCQSQVSLSSLVSYFKSQQLLPPSINVTSCLP
ncbi:uncharacterized protein LOC111306390 [Durio zibethinus]|uniref:Uncharacterized protein LOC111306390 n=1 Tax=Durio zibethinus TaxID=66656 RepID=A0A6P6A4X5_DURZI|nr:uncharacterized protein LOC111306390 [Durio zibethinus]